MAISWLELARNPKLRTNDNGDPTGPHTLLVGIDGQASSDSEWETVAASQTDQVMGTTGAIGDFLSHLIVVPATLSPGAVQIKDGSGSAITVFAGGASSILTLHSFPVILALKSLVGAWKITTGADVSVIACGDFT